MEICTHQISIHHLWTVEGIDPVRREKLIDLLDIDLQWRMHKVSDGQRRRVQICMGLLYPYKVNFLPIPFIHHQQSGNKSMFPHSTPIGYCFCFPSWYCSRSSLQKQQKVQFHVATEDSAQIIILKCFWIWWSLIIFSLLSMIWKSMVLWFVHITWFLETSLEIRKLTSHFFWTDLKFLLYEHRLCWYFV